jgi:hypothetical protein
LVQAKIAMQSKAIAMMRALPEQYGEILTFAVAGSKHRASERGGGLLVASAQPNRARRIGDNEQVFEG